jgi:hypothetical protein
MRPREKGWQVCNSPRARPQFAGLFLHDYRQIIAEIEIRKPEHRHPYFFVSLLTHYGRWKPSQVRESRSSPFWQGGSVRSISGTSLDCIRSVFESA